VLFVEKIKTGLDRFRFFFPLLVSVNLKARLEDIFFNNQSDAFALAQRGLEGRWENQSSFVVNLCSIVVNETCHTYLNTLQK
jgi:hypothetical protein